MTLGRRMLVSLGSSMKAERRIAAYERDHGVGLPALPWATARAAEGALSTAMRNRLIAFRIAVRNAWLEPDASAALGAAFAALDQRSVIALYPGAPDSGPAWFQQTITGRGLTSGPIKNHHLLPECRLYLLTGRDPFANRPVANAPLVRANSVASPDPMVFLDTILAPNEIPQQLRTVLYGRGKIRLFAGWYRGNRCKRFDADDHAMLLAAQPAMRVWDRTAAAIGPRPLGDGALVETLAALEAPALLLRRGRVVFANRNGRAWISQLRVWVAAGRPAHVASSTPLAPGGYEMELVLPVDRPAAFAALPRALQRVAHEIAKGASDKDIAVSLDMPLSTVRTYVTRILARLEVTSRRELMKGPHGRGAHQALAARVRQP